MIKTENRNKALALVSLALLIDALQEQGLLDDKTGNIDKKELNRLLKEDRHTKWWTTLAKRYTKLKSSISKINNALKIELLKDIDEAITVMAKDYKGDYIPLLVALDIAQLSAHLTDSKELANPKPKKDWVYLFDYAIRLLREQTGVETTRNSRIIAKNIFEYIKEGKKLSFFLRSNQRLIKAKRG
jgi:hypothetical protein